MDTRIPIEIMPNSGVTAGSYGPSADATPGYGVQFDVPYLTVDAKGRVTEAFTKKIKIPDSDNTDTKVTQTVTTTSGEYPLLAKNTTATSTITDTSRFAAGVTVNPSTKTITATKFKGDLEGNADSATEFAAAESVALTGDVTGSASSKAGWSVATTLSSSGVTAGSYGPSTNATPDYGATFEVPYITVDSKGRVTAAATKTVTIPASDNTDTKVTQTVSTDNSELPLLAKASNGTTTTTDTSKFAAAVKVNPSTGTVTATKFSGDVTNGTLGTASRAVVTDANKKLTVSSVTSTELGYVSGVTSAIQTQLNGKAASSHEHAAGDVTSGTFDAARIPSLDASKIATGTIDIARLPAGALERLVVVADQAARYALTTSDVQLGDTVKQTDTGVMYYVVDTSKLSQAAGYEEYTAGSATSVPWSGVTSKPSTISGYGITDAGISNGVITLGSNTITPLTAGSSLDASKLTGTASVDTTGNAGTATALETARYIDGVSFNGSADLVHYGTCSTAGNTAAKTVACTGYALKTGGRILVKFTNTNTASSPTLNVNSTGAKAIYVNGSAIAVNRLQGGTIYELVYNGSQYDLVDGKTTAKYTSSDPGTTVPTDLAEGGILIYS